MFLTALTLNSKVNDKKTNIAGMSHVNFKNIGETAYNFRTKINGLYNPLLPEEHGQEFDLTVFEQLSPVQVYQ